MTEVATFMLRLSTVISLVVAAPGCVHDSSFSCSTDSECGGNGNCEGNSFCSFPDTTCSEGRRFGQWSGSVANQCVDAASNGGCSAAYHTPTTGTGSGSGGAPLTGGSNAFGAHRYRGITSTAPWASQRDACAADGTSSYLAIVDDSTEFSSITQFVSGLDSTKIWVGVDDLATEGSYVTVRGGVAGYLPWATNQPDGGTQDCVATTKDSRRYTDELCTDAYVAVCECEPTVSN